MAVKQATVAIFVSQGFESRFLLRSSIFPRLKESFSRVVILSPSASEQAFIDEFKDENVELVHIDVAALDKYYTDSVIQIGLKRLRSHLLGGTSTNWTYIDDKRRHGQAYGKPERKWKRIPFDILLWMLRHSSLVRKGLTRFEGRFFYPKWCLKIIDSIRPDVVLVAGIGYRQPEAYLARAARKRGIRTLSAVYGWDKSYSQGYKGFDPDMVCCWGEAMRKEIIEFQDVRADRVMATGSAYFDTVYSAACKQAVRDVLETKGERKTKSILMATKSPNSYANYLACEMVARMAAEGRLGHDCRLLVRLHPIHLNKVYIKTAYGQYLIDYYDRIERTYPNVRIYRPMTASAGMRMDMSLGETDALVGQIADADVLVTLWSTIMLESFCLDVPVVNIGFDIKDDKSVRKFRPIQVDMNQIHIRRIRGLDCTWHARNEEELGEQIREALDNPEQRKRQQAAAIESELGRFDGLAGKRVVEALHRLL